MDLLELQFGCVSSLQPSLLGLYLLVHIKDHLDLAIRRVESESILRMPDIRLWTRYCLNTSIGTCFSFGLMS